MSELVTCPFDDNVMVWNGEKYECPHCGQCIGEHHEYQLHEDRWNSENDISTELVCDVVRARGDGTAGGGT